MKLQAVLATESGTVEVKNAYEYRAGKDGLCNAAVDIFLCDRCDPYQANLVSKEAFKPNTTQIIKHKKGSVL